MVQKYRSIDGLSAPMRSRRVVTAAQAQRRAEKITRSGGGLVPSATRKAVNSDFLAPVGRLSFDLEEEELFEKERKQTKKDLKKAKKAKKKKGGKKKFIILVLILLILGGLGFAYFWANGIIGKITDGNANIISLITAKDVELKTGSNGRTNVLVFGTSGYNMEGDEGNGTHDGAQLTDSIMIISFDQKTKDLAMLNLPRDLYVGTCTSTGKINEVYWCANPKGSDEEAGAKALEQKVGGVLGIDFQYYVHLNWGSLVTAVDAVGGITVTLDETINDSWTKTYIKAGEPTNLSGGQALGLARARHGTAGGDFTRGASQQKILMALQEKVLSQGLGLGDAMNLLNDLGDNLRMDFNSDEIKTIVNLGKNMSLEDLRQVPLTNVGSNKVNYVTTGMINGVSYVIPSAGQRNYTEIQKYVAKEFSSDPATREDADILVLNGSGTSGRAATEQKNLVGLGFNVAKIGDAPEGVYSAKYYLYDLSNGSYPGTLSSLESRYGVSAIAAENLPEGIAANGYDFVVIIGQGE